MKQTSSPQPFSLTALLGLALTGVLSAMPDIIVAPNTITTDTTWDSDTNDDGIIDQIYYMSRAVIVGNFDGGTRPTLTITPGTVIAASGSSAGNNGLDVGSLLIAQTGAISAQGTPEAPIVFTSSQEAEFLYNVDIDGDGINTVQPDAIGGDDDGSDGGQWGGVLILGNAPINFFNTPYTNLNSNSIEGFATTDAGANIFYGGDDPADNSGVLSYVSIRFGGFEFAQDEEINGLTMGGVGSGTQIDHIEVVANTDDAFEWFGGTVNTSHLIALYCQDEAFDFDEGHQGIHQFLLAVNSNNSDFGTEADGGNSTGSGIRFGEPLSTTQIFNATYIGSTGSEGHFRFKDNFAGQFHNGIFTNSGNNIVRIDDSITVDQVGENLLFNNNLFGTPANGISAAPNSETEEALVAQEGNQTDVDPQYTQITMNTAGEVIELDPRPLPGSPAWTDALTPGAPTATTYRGAFGTENWAEGWTYSSINGIIVGSGTIVPTEIPVTASSFDGVNFTIEFEAEAGTSYRITQSESLVDSTFVDVTGATLDATSEDGVITFEVPENTPKLFFRVESE